jgi:hypothetical protein
MSQEIEADTVSAETQSVIAVEAEPLAQPTEAVAVEAEAVVQSAEATPVEAIVASPVVQPAIGEEEEDEMEFDMEWD